MIKSNGTIEFTVDVTVESGVKIGFRSGIQETAANNPLPKITAVFQKFCRVLNSTFALVFWSIGFSIIDGTKDCAVDDKLSPTGYKQFHMLMMICWAAMLVVPRALEMT